MEYLTKQQIILLALLVSFVSSIATGIVTVSLLDQAPPAVTQTINRVVERTIERVSPSATTTTETIIVKDDQATIDAIAKASKVIVRLSGTSGESAVGVLVSSGGKILAHVPTTFPQNPSARLDGGNTVAARFISMDPATGIALFQAEQSSDPRSARAYSAASLADSAKLRLGQAIVAIGGREAPIVATGIVSSVQGDRIRTSAPGQDFDSQAILVNLLGEVVGMKDNAADNSFISSNQLKTYATP
jgi:S1-C subfamily serine protease